MAPRIRKIRHDEETRAKIQVTQLVNRLTKHALGLVDMPASAVRAAETLLDRRLPRMAQVEHSGEVEQSYVVRMPSVINALEDWDKQAKTTLELASDDPSKITVQ